MLAIYQYGAFCIALCMLPFQLGAAFIVESASVQASIESQEKYRVAGGIAEESLEGVKTIASCNAQEIRARDYQKELEPLKRSTTLMGNLHGFGWAVFCSALRLLWSFVLCRVHISWWSSLNWGQ